VLSMREAAIVIAFGISLAAVFIGSFVAYAKHVSKPIAVDPNSMTVSFQRSGAEGCLVVPGPKHMATMKEFMMSQHTLLKLRVEASKGRWEGEWSGSSAAARVQILQDVSHEVYRAVAAYVQYSEDTLACLW
jgi:hypothetical protein